MDLEPLAVEDCYTAVLELTSTVKEDQRLYHVIVENERGSDRRSLMLRVDEPGQVIIITTLAITPPPGCARRGNAISAAEVKRLKEAVK